MFLNPSQGRTSKCGRNFMPALYNNSVLFKEILITQEVLSPVKKNLSFLCTDTGLSIVTETVMTQGGLRGL